MIAKMTVKRSPSRQKLIQAALALFTTQGITETTTRQIAERAGVNEVTLFRQFGNKHGLLLSALEETEVFATWAQNLAQEAARMGNLEQALWEYGEARLEALESMPEFVRSLVGESGQYPTQNRQALGRELAQANQSAAQYLTTVIQQESLSLRIPPETLASLLNSLLLGYVILKLTSEFHQLWDSREDFLAHVVSLLMLGAVAQSPGSDAECAPNPNAHEQRVTPEIPAIPPIAVSDLPASVVHNMFKQARVDGPQSLALIYVLFGSGLSAAEVVQLQRRDYQGDRNQHLLQVPNAPSRRVPLNQWILGKRYGAPNKNPLSQWLRSRKDDQPALFILGDRPLALPDLEACWQRCAPDPAPLIIQAQQTWCIEMLLRGMTPENLSLLTAMSLAELEPYVQHARVKRALEQAIALDRKPGGSTTDGTIPRP